MQADEGGGEGWEPEPDRSTRVCKVGFGGKMDGQVRKGVWGVVFPDSCASGYAEA